jgi:rhodanese-related sulfurtransferase
MELERITPSEADRMLVSGAPVVFIDARSAESWEKATAQIPGSLRVPPDEAEAHLSRVPRDRMVITYCT